MRDGGGGGGSSKTSKVSTTLNFSQFFLGLAWPALPYSSSSPCCCSSSSPCCCCSSSLFVWFSQLSWSKSLVRKWFNIRGKSQDFHADAAAVGTGSVRSGERPAPATCSSASLSQCLCLCCRCVCVCYCGAHHSLPLSLSLLTLPGYLCHWKITLLFLPSTVPPSCCHLLLILVLVKLSKASTFQHLFSVLLHCPGIVKILLVFQID
jgi:hypothetical protein